MYRQMYITWNIKLPKINMLVSSTSQHANILTLYCVCGVFGWRGWTTINACKKWDAIMFGANGVLSSWKTSPTISLPMWRFLWSCKKVSFVNSLAIHERSAHSYASDHQKFKKNIQTNLSLTNIKNLLGIQHNLSFEIFMYR